VDNQTPSPCRTRWFEEAVAHLTDAGQRMETSAVFAVLAASCGHLGRISQARAALERYRKVTQVPVSEVSGMFRRPDHQELFLAGIALAQGSGASALAGHGKYKPT
jgi:hypothetical protein